MLGKRPRRIATTTLGLAVALVLGSAARAGMILPTHAFAGVGGGPTIGPFGTNLEGNGALDTGLQTYVAPQGAVPYAGSARAVTDVHADRLLRAYAQAGMYEAPGHSGGFSAVSSWRDVAFVDPANLPQVLRLNFVVDANLALIEIPESAIYYAHGLSKLGVSTTTNPVNFFDPGTRAVVGNPGDLGHQYEASLRDQGASPDPVRFDVGGNGWDSYRFAGGHFTGTFHIDTTYDAALGGYGWGLMLQTYAEAYGSGARVDALNTLKLRAVTLTDGTPVAATFDSGLRLSSVPEPASVVMLGAGALILLGYGWRRRAGGPGRPGATPGHP